MRNGVNNLDSRVKIQRNSIGVFRPGIGGKRVDVTCPTELTYTRANAEWIAAVRSLTATRGLRPRTAASNGARYGFS